MFKVFIETVPRMGLNGDRATTQSPYSDFRIHLGESDDSLGSNTVVHTISQYDGYNSVILKHKLKDARDFADNLARFSAQLFWKLEF